MRQIQPPVIPLEADILRQCLDYLRLRGIPAWRQNQGGIRATYRGRRRFVRFAGIEGISDILGLLPPSGRLLAVECKRPGGKPSPQQLAFLEQVRAAGGLAVVVHSLHELEAALREAGC